MRYTPGTTPCSYPGTWGPPRPATLPDGAPVLATPPDGSLEVLACAEGVYRLDLAGSPSSGVHLEVTLAPGEVIAGFGEQFVRVDQRGRTVRGWIEDILQGDPRSTYYMAPLFYSSAGYTLLVDTYAEIRADVGESIPDRLVIDSAEPALQAYLLIGPPAAAAKRVLELTGRGLRLPDWGLGVWVCSLGGSDRVLDEARRLRAEAVPCDAIWVYDQYDEATNTGWGNGGTYPEGAYPDLRALVSGLHELGFKAMTYLNPYVFQDTCWYRETAPELTVSTPSEEPATFAFMHPQSRPFRVCGALRPGRLSRRPLARERDLAGGPIV